MLHNFENIILSKPHSSPPAKAGVQPAGRFTHKSFRPSCLLGKLFWGDGLRNNHGWRSAGGRAQRSIWKNRFSWSCRAHPAM